jgi:feruloyl-CoA synthase
MSVPGVTGLASGGRNEPPRHFLNKFAPPSVEIERRGNGEILVRSGIALKPYPASLGCLLDQWAAAAPEQTFLAERDLQRGSWCELSYSAARQKVRSIAQSLLDRGLGPGDTLVIISENSIEHALVSLGTIYAGVAAVPVSTAYARTSSDFAKLRQIIDVVCPKLVYIDDAAKCAGALKAINFAGAELVVSNEDPAHPIKVTRLEALTGQTATAAVDAAAARAGPGTIAKILFTSGSTDLPKGVINTHRMLCSNQQMIAQVWPFLLERPPVLVDWLPWSHTFGGNHNFNMVLRHGGTLYIDSGKPVPGLIDKTIAALKEISPTAYFNVPRGYSMLIDRLEQDAALRDRFFSNLDIIFYAAAALPQSSWTRLEALSVAAVGEKIPMISSWGLTETAPLVTAVHYQIDRAGVIGLPAPGMELKLVPNDGKLEMRVRGPAVFPGYYKRQDLTQAAFDEEGFFLTGDAGAFADPDDPSKGLRFDGRLGENFKLTSGTWVHVGSLRIALIAAAAPLIDDIVIAGHDRDEIGLLIFPSHSACREIAAELPQKAPIEEVLASRAVREAIGAAIERHNGQAGGASSMRVTRALLLSEPPSLDRNEITDKGYVNQRAVLNCRKALVEQLFEGSPHTSVLMFQAAHPKR